MHESALSLESFNYNLPPERIAQSPLPDRDASRLLVLDREADSISHCQFPDIQDYLRPGDVLVGNNSRVMPARLYGKKSTGGQVELLLLEQLDSGHWTALVGGRRITPGVTITLLDLTGEETDLRATVVADHGGPQREIAFDQPIENHWQALGHTPLPPYIHSQIDDGERYQTIYARPVGSAAAPTAGLHFSADLLLALRGMGVRFETVTLHVGLDTFKPVEEVDITDHTIHTEWMSLTADSARVINQAKLAGNRIFAVGTTSVRVLETAAWRSAGEFGSLRTASQQQPPGFCPWKPVVAHEGRTDLYIYPGYHFRVVDGLITNFHLPQSTLMMLVGAFAGLDNIKRAYQEALDQAYRFLSFGDAMLIL